MAFIRITKKFSFETAHALSHYDGWCRNIHGHSYVLFVTVGGHTLNEKNHPKEGMVLDFSILKKIVLEHIIQYFDHCLIINNSISESALMQLKKMSERIITVPFQPTCENLTIFIADTLNRELPKEIKLMKVKLYETESSYSEWREEDNK
ncbi:MAG: 6-pyruvoyl trahydropterin synthase family protein [Cytophagaceae bacterium]